MTTLRQVRLEPTDTRTLDEDAARGCIIIPDFIYVHSVCVVRRNASRPLGEASPKMGYFPHHRDSTHSLLVQRNGHGAMLVPHPIPARLAKQRRRTRIPATNHRRTVFARDHATPAAVTVPMLSRRYTLAHSVNYTVPLWVPSTLWLLGRLQCHRHDRFFALCGLGWAISGFGSPRPRAYTSVSTHQCITSQIHGVWPLLSFQQ